MNRPAFSALEALRFGLGRFSQEAGYCLLFLGLIELILLWSGATAAFLLTTLAQLVMQLDAAPSDSYLVSFVLSYLVIRGCAQLVVNKWLLMMYEGQKVSFAELLGYDFGFHCPRAMKMVAASLVFNFYTVFGSVLFVLPGLFAASVLRFYKFAVAEQDTDALEALRLSYEMSGDFKGQLVFLSLLTSGLKVAGLLCFGVGLIPACAISGFAEAYAYKRLLSRDNRSDRSGSPTLN